MDKESKCEEIDVQLLLDDIQKLIIDHPCCRTANYGRIALELTFNCGCVVQYKSEGELHKDLSKFN
jgi:hypothetical protein